MYKTVCMQQLWQMVMKEDIPNVSARNLIVSEV
jgi:hypothetical protein